MSRNRATEQELGCSIARGGGTEGGVKMEKMDIFEIRKGRGGGDRYFWRLQTDGIDSNGRKPYIPRRIWLIIQKEGVPGGRYR